MKNITEFIKTTLLGGLFVLLPLLLLYLLLAETFGLIVGLATPIADLFPEGTFDEAKFPVLLAVILIVVVSFLIGLMLRLEIGRRMGGWIEKRVLGRLPAYEALKKLTSGFVETGKEGSFQSAFLISENGDRDPVYVVEEHADGHMTVLVSWSPTAFAGSVKIVKRERVEMLDVSLGDFSKALSYWGVGMSDCMDKRGTRKE